MFASPRDRLPFPCLFTTIPFPFYPLLLYKLALESLLTSASNFLRSTVEMVSFTAITSAAIVAFATVSAAPAEHKSLAARSNGELTWYNPGLGACGETNSDGDAVVAVSASIFDSEKVCNRKIRVTYKGKQATVRVVDRCAGCSKYDLDLSPTAFETVVGDKGLGRVAGSWDWA